jgi:hypothetical protein
MRSQPSSMATDKAKSTTCCPETTSNNGIGAPLTQELQLKAAVSIVTDTGRKVALYRGLEIFLPPIKTEVFSLGDRMQENPLLKGFTSPNCS